MFGVNVRHEYLDFYQKLKPNVDFLELIVENINSYNDDVMNSLRENYPLSFHSVSMNIGSSLDLDIDFFKALKKNIDKFQPVLISGHLSFEQSHNMFHHDLLPFPMNQKNLKNVVQRVLQIQSLLDCELLIENLSYYVHFEESEMTESSFLNEICEKTGAKVLLDLNNIDINEMNKIDEMDRFLGELNMENVAQLHLAGGEKNGEFIVDTHASFPKENVLKAAHTIIKKKSIPVVYERDNNFNTKNEYVKDIQLIREKIF